MADFDELRAQRYRWLAEIASVEAGNPPAVEHKTYGEPAENNEEYLARLKDWVAANERHLSEHGEPFDG